MNSATLDLLFFQRLWRLFGVLFETYNSRSAVIFYSLIVLSLLLQLVIYAAGLTPSKFFEVLGAKDANAFPSLASYALIVILLNAVMKSMLTYLSHILYLTWRQKLCMKLHEKYFGKMMFYQLNVLDNSLDNIDQRITKDANLFTKEWSTLMARSVVLPFTMVYYSYQCFISTTWLGPVLIYVYFFVGTLVNRFIMTPMVQLKIKQEVQEGNFRYQHLNVRINSESMAFYKAGDIEHRKSNEKLKTLLNTELSLFNWSFWLNLSVNIFHYVGGILSYLIIAIPIFAGFYNNLSTEELSALISRNSFVSMYLINTFSQLIDMSGTLGHMAAHTHRLAQIFETIDKKNNGSAENCCNNLNMNDQNCGLVVNNDDKDFNAATLRKRKTLQYEDISKTEEHCIRAYENSKRFFTLYDVSYFTPDNSVILVDALSLSIEQGKNILISGPTGSGKTTLLRILAGLRCPSNGFVQKCMNFGPHGVMYLPQKPLVTDGTLLDQVTYPCCDPQPKYSEMANQEQIQKVWNEVGLSDLVENHEGALEKSEVNWSDKLSMGEMQRLSFARLLYHHPNLAVLDEPTSGLSEATENHLFKLCKKQNITCVTVGHRSNLKRDINNLIN